MEIIKSGNRFDIVLLGDSGGNPVVPSSDVSQYLNIASTKVLTTSAVSQQTAAVGSTTKRVVITVMQDTWIAIGDNPTATKGAGSFLLFGGTQSYPILVKSGVTKIAALQDSTSGSVSIIESE